jgi:hypothetical protein
VGVLGAVVLLWGNDVSPTRLFWSLLLTVVLLGIVQILVGAGRGTEAATAVPAPADGDVQDATTERLPGISP